MKSPLIPHITEKSYALASSELPSELSYTFLMNGHFNKSEVAKMVTQVYSVTVIDVRTVTLPRKYRLVKGIKGKTAVRRKAIVRLKSGQKIDGFIQDSPQAPNE